MIPIYCTCKNTSCSPTRIVNTVGGDTFYINPITKEKVILVVSIKFCMTCGYPVGIERTNVNKN